MVTTHEEETTDRAIVTERTYDAPLDLVWRAWTEARHVDEWFGPDGFKTTTEEMDVRPGGLWRFTMSHPQYGDFNNRVTYIEVVRGEKLVYDHGSDDDPQQFVSTVTFTAEGDRTHVRMRGVFPTVEHLESRKKFGAVEGAQQTMAKLAEYLKRR